MIHTHHNTPKQVPYALATAKHSLTNDEQLATAADRNPTGAISVDARFQCMLTKSPWWWRSVAEDFGLERKKQKQAKKADIRALLVDLKSCAIRRDLQSGRKLHAKALEFGDASSTSIANALVNMYAKCGSMIDARQVFESIKQPDVVSWTALLSGYAEHGDGLVALDLFTRMKSQGYAPDSVTYVAALKACIFLSRKQDRTGRGKSLDRVKDIHSEIMLHPGCQSDLKVQNTLIDVYSKCGSMICAHQVFDSLTPPSVVSWNALLLGHADAGEGLITLDLLSRMKSRGFAPNSITYVAALKACASLTLKQDASGRAECLERVKQIHLEIGCRCSRKVQNTLIGVYAKCGSMVDAHHVFDSMKPPDVVSWTLLLSGYADLGQGLVALDLFSRMKSQGCAPDSRAFVAALKACASLKQECNGKGEALELGKQIHSEIPPCHGDVYVQNTLIDMYVKCGSMADARRVFDGMRHPDVVSWTALLSGYADSGESLIALELFLKMKFQGCSPNSITYAAVLKASSLLGALEFGRRVHAEIRDFDEMLVTCLVDFYAKCGSLLEAQEVFDRHSKLRNRNAWTALLAGYSRFGETSFAFNVFEEMQKAGFQPDDVTFRCILMCCSHANLVRKAVECFGAMCAKYGVTPGAEHYNCMVDVLGRANKLDDAVLLLQRMPCSPDAVTWITVLSSCHKWKNVDLGRLAFQSLVTLDERNAVPYVLMARIYANRPAAKALYDLSDHD